MKNILYLLLLLPCVVFAGEKRGNDQGNGGDVFALQFTVIAEKVFTYLEASPIKDVPVAQLRKSLTEVSVESVNHELILDKVAKDAINYPNDKKIIFNRLRWVQIADADRPALVLHEYLGIIGVADQDYKYSKQILGNFKLTTNFMPNAYCGRFEDNGDSFQIIDGIYNAYVAGGDDERPKDLKEIESYLWKDNPQGKCYCLIGLIQPYDRGGEIAYMFTDLLGLKKCQNVIR